VNGGAFWLITAPVAVALISYPLRKTFVAGLVTAAWCGLVSWILYLWPTGIFWVFGRQVETTRVWEVAGFSFQLTRSGTRSWMFMAYLTLLGLALLAVLFPEMRPGLAWGNFWLSALATVWLSTSVWQSFLFISLAAAIAAMGLAGPPSARGAWRAMLFPVLVYPLTVVAHRYASMAPLRPGDLHPLAAASVLLSAAIFPLLLLFPFHGAFPAVGEESRPTPAILWVLLWPEAIQALLYRLSQQAPWWNMESGISWLTWAVWGTLAWVLLAAAWQRKSGRLWGYAALVTWVFLLRQSESTWTMYLWRGLGLVAAAFAFSVERSDLGWKLLPRRLAWVRRWSSVLLYLAGMLALAALMIQGGGVVTWEGALRAGAGASLAVGTVSVLVRGRWWRDRPETV
jgi:hypothetical protein